VRPRRYADVLVSVTDRSNARVSEHSVALTAADAALQTLGRVELRTGSSISSQLVPAQPKRLALLAYLAIESRQTPPTRERLLALFWPEATDAEARAALRQSLHHLRQAIGTNAITSSSDDRLTIDPAHLSCDAVLLTEAAAAADYRRVLSLYQGDFFDAATPRDVAQELEEWFDRTQRSLRRLAVTAAARLAGDAERAGRIDEAIDAATRATELSPDDEESLRARLRLLEAGDRAAEALTVADQAASQFMARLGVPLAPATQQLITDIRARRIAAGNVPVVAGQSTPPHRERRPELVHASTPHGVREVARPNAPSRRVLVFGAATAALLVVAWTVAKGRTTVPQVEAMSDAASSATAVSVDRLLVADFADDGDGTGAAVAAALRVDITQSPNRRVLSGVQLAAAARRAVPSGAVTLDDSLLRVIAQREGVRALVTGEVHRAGTAWVLTAQLLSPRDGAVLAAVRTDAADSSAIIPAIEKLSRTLAKNLGVALSNSPAPEPLAQVTSTSLEALRAYSDGARLIDAGERRAGIARLERAVALDSGFATAWRVLGAAWNSSDEPARARDAMRRAFEHRARLTFRERQLVAGTYHRNVTFDRPAAVAAYRNLLEQNPADITALNNLALVYMSIGDRSEAVALFRRVIAADSTLVSPRLGLAEQLALAGRHGEATAVMDEAARRFPDNPITRITPIYLAIAAERWARAESLATVYVNATTDAEARVDALQTLGRIELARGKLTRAAAHLDSSMTGALAAGSDSRYLGGAATRAWLELRYRDDPERARSVIDRALARRPLARVPVDDRPVAELVELLLALGRREQAVAAAGGTDTASMPVDQRRLASAALLLSEGRAALAVPVLEAEALTADRADCPLCPLPRLAMARVAVGDTAGGIRAAEEYLTTPTLYRFESDPSVYPLLVPALAEWYTRRGAPEDAARTWRRLITRWGDSDASLAGRLADARRRASPFAEPLPR
jgi:eukaryotic-like serine/threonine-protein kinase